MAASVPQQGSEAWKALRFGNINSTDGAVIEGVNQHKKVAEFEGSMSEVWLVKTLNLKAMFLQITAN